MNGLDMMVFSCVRGHTWDAWGDIVSPSQVGMDMGGLLVKDGLFVAESTQLYRCPSCRRLLVSWHEPEVLS